MLSRCPSCVRLRACPADQLCRCHGRRTQGTTLHEVQEDFRVICFDGEHSLPSVCSVVACCSLVPPRCNLIPSVPVRMAAHCLGQFWKQACVCDQWCMRWQAVTTSFHGDMSFLDTRCASLDLPVCWRLQSRAWTPLKGPQQPTLSCRTLAWLVEAGAMQQARQGVSVW